MSGRRVLLVVAALLGLAGLYLWAISVPAKEAARARRSAQPGTAPPRTERVRAPSATRPRATSVQRRAEASMVTAWLDPRSARAFRALVPATDRPAPVATGIRSPVWFDVVMRAPYSAVDASPGERTRGDGNLREYRDRADRLFALLAAGDISPSEALLRYRELDAARVERDRSIFGAERAHQLEKLRAQAAASRDQ